MLLFGGVVMGGLPSLSGGVAIITGSGLAEVGDRFPGGYRLPYSEVDGLPSSSVPGHPGFVQVGDCDGLPVAVFRGRVHLYEGFSARQVGAHVRLAAEAGVKVLVTTAAVGAVHAHWCPGDVVGVVDHVNFTGANPLVGSATFAPMGEAYSSRLLAVARGAMAVRGPGRWREGVYAATLGPSYETPAEVRALAGMGADVVGMSMVCDTVVAAAAGVEVLGLAVVTNWASGVSDVLHDHGSVTAAASAAAPLVADVVADVVSWLASSDGRV